MTDRRVVVTGIGVVSSIGTGIADFFSALINGKSGCGPISSFDCSGNEVKMAAEVKDFDPAAFMNIKTTKRTSRFIQFAVASAKMALEAASCDVSGRPDVGVYIGTGGGGYDSLDESYNKFRERGGRAISPFAMTCVIPNMAASNVSLALGVHGPSVAPVAACASGLYAVYDAYNAIRHGHINAAFAGGTESIMTSFVLSGYEAMGVLSIQNDMPQAASRPFDKSRDGFVIGEGAAVLFLEDYGSAIRRGAEIYGEITGCSASCDASHIVTPDPTGNIISSTMLNAFNRTDMAPEEIAFISAHGTSTVISDKVEAKAIWSSFSPEGGYRPPVTAIKSMIGHTFGASGPLALAAGLMSLRNNVIPPTINTHEVDGKLPQINLVTEKQGIDNSRTYALINAFGFGGHNACVSIRRAE